MPARSSCGARKLTACVVTLSRACWLLHSLPGADVRSSTRARSTQTVAPHLPLRGSKAIPVDMLTASGARARSPDTPRHLSHVCLNGRRQSGCLEPGPIESGAASPMWWLEEELGYTARGIGQTLWRARRAAPPAAAPASVVLSEIGLMGCSVDPPDQ